MPKKKNFLGGMQNYNPNNGEYESALVGKNGEPVSSFKSFKKQDSEFTKSNDKRTGKSKKGLGYDPRDRKASTENHNKIINEINDKYGKDKMSKKEYWDAIDREVDRWNNEQQYWYEHDDSYDPDLAEQQAERRKNGIYAGMEDKNVNQQLTNESPKKYFKHPQVDGVWHDTGKTMEKYGNTYKVFENEEGHTWGVSDKMSSQFEEVEEPKHAFKLDKEKYPDVEETPYGFVYNVGNQSITDVKAQEKAFGKQIDDNKDYGFTLTVDGDEVYYKSFDEAYAAAKKGGGEQADEKDVGKIIKYKPYMRTYTGMDFVEGYSDEEIRAKKLNNGLAMETKKYKSRGQFDKNEKGQYVEKTYYKLVDIESGLSAGRAESFEDALKKSKDPEFVEKLERARANYWKAHPDRKREKPESKSDSAKKLSFKKEMDKARAKMEKYWSNTDLNRHMRGEMDYLLSNFEHDNGKQYAIDEAKRNIQKWQKFGWLDINEMRDEKLVYFQKMIEYMENNK